MFAAAVGVHRAVEADVRRLVAGDHALRRLAAHLGGAGRGYVLFPAVVERLAAGRGEAVVRVVGGAATARGVEERHGDADG